MKNKEHRMKKREKKHWHHGMWERQKLKSQPFEWLDSHCHNNRETSVNLHSSPYRHRAGLVLFFRFVFSFSHNSTKYCTCRPGGNNQTEVQTFGFQIGVSASTHVQMFVEQRCLFDGVFKKKVPLSSPTGKRISTTTGFINVKPVVTTIRICN